MGVMCELDKGVVETDIPNPMPGEAFRIAKHNLDYLKSIGFRESDSGPRGVFADFLSHSTVSRILLLTGRGAYPKAAVAALLLNRQFDSRTETEYGVKYGVCFFLRLLLSQMGATSFARHTGRNETNLFSPRVSFAEISMSRIVA